MTAEATVRRTAADQGPGGALNARGAHPSTGMLANRGDHSLYRWAAIAAFAVVVVGFARTYYLKLLFGAPALPWLLHLHGALMTSWFVLFFVQTSLIAAVDLRFIWIFLSSSTWMRIAA